MWRDVFRYSLNKGQFIPALVAFIIAISILKMPSEDVSKLIFEILAKLESGYLIGYAVGIFSLIGWYTHSRWQRRLIAREMQRIGLEKSQLQNEKLNGKIKSSQ